MEFAFSDEQEMIRASAEGLLADVSDSAAVRAAMVSERGFDEALWQRLCQEMCWPAIHIPEAYGGSGLGMVELALAIEELCAAGAGGTLAQIFMLNPIFGGMGLMLVFVVLQALMLAKHIDVEEIKK